jgi:hypothetical protein
MAGVKITWNYRTLLFPSFLTALPLKDSFARRLAAAMKVSRKNEASRYSVRKATIGSTRAASRAG